MEAAHSKGLPVPCSPPPERHQTDSQSVDAHGGGWPLRVMHLRDWSVQGWHAAYHCQRDRHPSWRLHRKGFREDLPDAGSLRQNSCSVHLCPGNWPGAGLPRADRHAETPAPGGLDPTRGHYALDHGSGSAVFPGSGQVFLEMLAVQCVLAALSVPRDAQQCAPERDELARRGMLRQAEGRLDLLLRAGCRVERS